MKLEGAVAIVTGSATRIGAACARRFARRGARVVVNYSHMALAHALAPEIRVNAVCPGLIETRWMRDLLGDDIYAALERRIAQTAPMGRVARPDNAADAVRRLAEGRDYVTGDLLSVDGGVRLSGGLRNAAPRN